ncbi:MAG: prepilin-type N-terminal cleavage/methylation domain-containing protein [bacterium]
MAEIKKTKGFSLVELLIVMAILVILAFVSIPVLRYFQEEMELINSTEKVSSLLRAARTKTMASEESSHYGVYFNDEADPQQYILFKGENYISRDPLYDEVHFLPKEAEIYSISFGGGKEIVFEKITGETLNEGEISFRLVQQPEKTRTIYIEGSGQVGLTDIPSSSDDARIKDSRHVHFALGWSIRDAAELKFYFPSAMQTEMVSMAANFNGDKTSFSWDGEFTVGGSDQVFTIHTHNLDAFATELCIHRDRNNGNNDKEVIIYIVDGGVDKDIAHYLADSQDVLEKGNYAVSFEKQ